MNLKKLRANQKIEIVEVPFGIASRVENKVYVHNKLKLFNLKLYEAIMAHELKHTDGFSSKDIRLDILNKELSGLTWKYYQFILTHPSSLSEFLPFWFYENKLQINITLSLFYLIIIIGGITTWNLIG